MKVSKINWLNENSYAYFKTYINEKTVEAFAKMYYAKFSVIKYNFSKSIKFNLTLNHRKIKFVWREKKIKNILI